MTADEGVLKCLNSAIVILNTQDELTDFQAMLMRDLGILCSQIAMYMSPTANDEEVPLRDNVVEFKPRGEVDENQET